MITATRTTREKIVIPTEEIPFAQLWINGRGKGKARPRRSVHSGKVYMPEDYRYWQQLALWAIKLQMKDLPPAPESVGIECLFVNFFSSDSDNLTGAVADVLVKVGYLANDSYKFVKKSSGEFVKMRARRNQPKEIGILTNIYKRDYTRQIPVDSLDIFRTRYPKLFDC
jgi:Holliday junction resolvase RusA-like endonuclease